VYQTPAVVPTPETIALMLPDSLNPRYSYGGSKIVSELIAFNYGQDHYRKVQVFRPHNVFGPNMGWKHVEPQFIVRALAAHGDGFELAEIDLRLRGEGELVGTRQHGQAAFRVAELPRDAELLERAAARARVIASEDPGLERPEHALLAAALTRTYGSEAQAPIRA